jgi:hypothetical protein
MALVTFLQRTTKIFSMDPFKACDSLHTDDETRTNQKRLRSQHSPLELFFLNAVVETSPLLCCSSAAPLDIYVAIQRARTLARNDLHHRMQHASLQQKLSTPRLTEACELARRALRKGMYHARYRPQLSPSLLSAFAHYPCQYLSKRQRFVLVVGRDEFN